MNTVLIYSENDNTIASIQLALLKYPQFNVIPNTDILLEIKHQIKVFSPKLIILDFDNKIDENINWIKNNCNPSIELIIISDYHFFNNKLLNYSLAGYFSSDEIEQQLDLSLKRGLKNIEKKVESSNRLKTLLTIANQHSHHTISLKVKNGIELIDTHQIISISAKKNKSEIKLMNYSITINQSINEFERLLQDLIFFRIHRSHIINLLHVSKYIKNNGGNVEMIDASVFSVSVNKKSEFHKRLDKITLNI